MSVTPVAYSITILNLLNTPDVLAPPLPVYSELPSGPVQTPAHMRFPAPDLAQRNNAVALREKHFFELIAKNHHNSKVLFSTSPPALAF